jgi:hypothetical protein
MTRAVETIIQAVSPEFKPSDATAEETGSASNKAASSRLFGFMFKTCSPFKLDGVELFKF